MERQTLSNLLHNVFVMIEVFTIGGILIAIAATVRHFGRRIFGRK